MRSDVIKEKTGWRSKTRNKLCPSWHHAVMKNLTGFYVFLTNPVVFWIIHFSVLELLNCWYFPLTSSDNFVASALPSSQTNLSLYFLGCFLAGFWFVRLESWQTVFDHPDPPLHDKALVTAGCQLERKKRSATERCANNLVDVSKKTTSLTYLSYWEDYKDQWKLTWSNMKLPVTLHVFAHFLFKTSSLLPNKGHTLTQGSDAVSIYKSPYETLTCFSTGPSVIKEGTVEGLMLFSIFEFLQSSNGPLLLFLTKQAIFDL